LLAAVVARPQTGPTSDYVGSEKCKDCHETEYTAFAAGAHGQAAGDRTVLGHSVACETCHGPGSRHVEADGDKDKPGFWDIKSFKKMKVADINATCRSCHGNGEQLHWDNSAHARPRSSTSTSTTPIAATRRCTT
jgi:hypothetical protein